MLSLTDLRCLSPRTAWSFELSSFGCDYVLEQAVQCVVETTALYTVYNITFTDFVPSVSGPPVPATAMLTFWPTAVRLFACKLL